MKSSSSVAASEQPSGPSESRARSSVRGIAIAAMLLMVGNLASRVFGLMRESVIGGTFATADVSLFGALSAVPTQLYDFLVGGLVSAALVPVFSDYIEADDDANLWSLVNTVLTLVLLALLVVGGLIALVAPWITRFLATDLVTPANQTVATGMLRLMIVAVVFMGLSGLLTGLLQARQRFLLPAFTTSIFNVGLIVIVLFKPHGSALVLAAGMLAGAVAQVILQLPGLRGVRIRPQIDLQHPGVRRIARLYAPVALGISFSLIGTAIDRRLASSSIVGTGAIAYMRWATTLIQFTLGMVAAAISLAILPTLSRLNSANDEAGFRRVFSLGLKTVVLLIVPAMVLLAVLGATVIRLLFQHGEFSAHDTQVTALVLLAYLPSLLAAAVDQPLIFAFYARKHTLLPNLVQGVAIIAYTAVALACYRIWHVYGLVLANVIQWVVHAGVMTWLAQRQFQLFSGQQFRRAFSIIALASLAMGAVAWALQRVFPSGDSMLISLLRLLIVGGSASLVYFGLLWRLRLDAFDYFMSAVLRRLRKQPSS